MNKKLDTATEDLLRGLSAEIDVQQEDVSGLFPSIKSNPDKLEEASQLSLKKFEAELERIRKDTQNRSVFAYWTFGIITAWLIAVIVLLACNFLSQSIYITLLTTTTLNVIGLPAIVLRGYFKS